MPIRCSVLRWLQHRGIRPRCTRRHLASEVLTRRHYLSTRHCRGEKNIRSNENNFQISFFLLRQVFTDQPVAFRSPAPRSEFASGTCFVVETRQQSRGESQIWTVSFMRELLINQKLHKFPSLEEIKKFSRRRRHWWKSEIFISFHHFASKDEKYQ